jgi:hypothetical protein
MHRAGVMILLLASLLLAGSAPQDPSTRTIDSTPKIVLRPPTDTIRIAPPPADHLPSLPTADSDRDRRLDLELDLKDRRDALRESEGASARDYAIAIACVLVAAVVIVSFLLWVAKRREG